jgi:acetyl esterase/lipase
MKRSIVVSIVVAVLLNFLFTGCTFKAVKRTKNIRYNNTAENDGQQLNVFAPKHKGDLRDVLIFVHGGSWNSGKKSLYNFFGSRLARKNVVAVIIDYPLSPTANYNDMAIAVSTAVKWTQENIRAYGGNPRKIFLSGHSAGGHLASLVSLRNAYFDSLGMANPIKGTILIDAAGLDMYGYLKEENFPGDHTYFKTFTKNPLYWKDASPLFHLHTGMPPMLIYRGGKTYPSIIDSHDRFLKSLKDYVPVPRYSILKAKHHVGMITQFFNSWNPRYKEIAEFMKNN